MDKDLESVQEARMLCEQSLKSQATIAEFSQNLIDTIVKSIRDTALEHAETLAREAIEETNLGILEDKVTKNRFAAKDVYEYVKDMKTVGIISEQAGRKVYEIAEPMGPIAAIIPVTNPTSTVIFKSLIALKARNTIIFAPHPRAAQCSRSTAELMSSAARAAGAPEFAIQCMKKITLKGTEELMQHPGIGLILATGGTAMVRAAYSSGKPAIGVGPGNVPAYLDRSCDIDDAVEKILRSKSFDNGTVCSSEQAVVCDEPIDKAVREAFRKQGAYFLSSEEREQVKKIHFTADGLPTEAVVGQSAPLIAERAGFSVPPEVKVLIVEPEGVGEEYPLSREKISPVLAYYVEKDWKYGCLRCIEILKLQGIGHTLVIHAKDEKVIREFALKKPAFRILANTPGTHGAIGLSTGLTPSLTLGCGTWGGGITSDNVSPLHLLNIKRLAYDVAAEGPREAETMELAEKPAEQKVQPEPQEAPAEQPEIEHENTIQKADGPAPLSEQEIERIMQDFIASRRKKSDHFR
jgi:acetaldehyde dehydrogenase (acetylating)